VYTVRSQVKQRIVFLIGASGVGKTAVARLLEKRQPWINNTFYSDSIGVPSPEEMDRWPGGGEGWQQWATAQWVTRLAGRNAPLQLLEMQTRPSFILPALEVVPKIDPLIILLECSPSVRGFRLTELRQQPDLANAQMENWAVYLRGQADALSLPSIQTDKLTLDEVAVAVEAEALKQA
jgi:hypothetical protein